MAKYSITEFPKAKISDIIPSETKPQQIRRKRYTEKNLQELAESIKQQGVLEPLIVRAVKNKLELVAGERRWRASAMAKLKEIPFILRELSDEQVVIIQLHENLHRENPHPLDEAYNYGFMRDEMAMAVEQIAHEVGKDVPHVEQRLKLLILPDFIREAYERREISLSHIQEIAKYPATDHAEVFSYCFSNYGHTSQALYPFAKAKEQIEQHYLLQLSKAPFPLDSDKLRSDGRTCLSCVERTGAHPTLWVIDGVGEKDSCYNRQCYNGKVEKFVQLKRVSTATNVLHFPPEKIENEPIKEVPVVTSREPVFKEDIPTVNVSEIFIIEKNACAYTKIGIGGDGENIGKEIYYCDRPAVCGVHRSEEPKTDSAEYIAEKKFQKEEAFQVLIGEVVRKEVLWQIAKSIQYGDLHLRDAGFTDDLINKMLSTATAYELDIIRFTLDERMLRASTDGLNDDEKERVLFLLVYASEGQMTDSYVSQSKIKTLAKNFNLDYQMIDAVKRLELAPDEHKKTFYNYLRKIEDGERETPIPLCYSERWAE